MAFANPAGNVEQLGLKEGMHVADLGAGTGAYTIPLAAAVGDSGRVYAVEVQKELLQNIKSAANAEHLRNIELLWGDIERLGSTKIADHAVDYVIVANVLFQIEDREGFMAEVKRILRPGGKLLLVDWKDSYGGMGPQPEHVIAPDTARALFERNGFSFEKEIQTGEQHYGFIVVK